jgi:hypothetical protein
MEHTKQELLEYIKPNFSKYFSTQEMEELLDNPEFFEKVSKGKEFFQTLRKMVENLPDC